MSNSHPQNQSLSNKFQIGQANYSPVFRPSCTSTAGTETKGTVMDDTSSKSSSKLDVNCNKSQNNDRMDNMSRHDNDNSISSNGKVNFRKLHREYYHNWHKRPPVGEPRPMRLIEFMRHYTNSRPLRETPEIQRYMQEHNEMKKKRQREYKEWQDYMNDVRPKKTKTLQSNLDGLDNHLFDLTIENSTSSSVSSDLSDFRGDIGAESYKLGGEVRRWMVWHLV